MKEPTPEQRIVADVILKTFNVPQPIPATKKTFRKYIGEYAPQLYAKMKKELLMQAAQVDALKKRLLKSEEPSDEKKVIPSVEELDIKPPANGGRAARERAQSSEFKAEVARYYLQEGQTLLSTANHFRAGTTTISDILKEQNISFKSVRRKYSSEEMRSFAKFYWDSGLGTKPASDILKISRATLQKAIRQFPEEKKKE